MNGTISQSDTVDGQLIAVLDKKEKESLRLAVIYHDDNNLIILGCGQFPNGDKKRDLGAFVTLYAKKKLVCGSEREKLDRISTKYLLRHGLHIDELELPPKSRKHFTDILISGQLRDVLQE